MMKNDIFTCEDYIREINKELDEKNRKLDEAQEIIEDFSKQIILHRGRCDPDVWKRARIWLFGEKR